MMWVDQWASAHAETGGKLLEKCFFDVCALSEAQRAEIVRPDSKTGWQVRRAPRSMLESGLELDFQTSACFILTFFFFLTEVGVRNGESLFLFVSPHVCHAVPELYWSLFFPSLKPICWLQISQNAQTQIWNNIRRFFLQQKALQQCLRVSYSFIDWWHCGQKQSGFSSVVVYAFPTYFSLNVNL